VLESNIWSLLLGSGKFSMGVVKMDEVSKRVKTGRTLVSIRGALSLGSCGWN